MQRLQDVPAGADLVGQRRHAQSDAFAPVSFALAVLMLAELLEQDHRQQVRPGEVTWPHVERAGSCVIVSHARHENFSRTVWITAGSTPHCAVLKAALAHNCCVFFSNHTRTNIPLHCLHCTNPIALNDKKRGYAVQKNSRKRFFGRHQPEKELMFNPIRDSIKTLPTNAPSQTGENPGEKAQLSRHPAILRVSALGVAGVLAALMITAVVPPIVADQSDRAVIDAPVTLLTSPIAGEIDSLEVEPGNEVTGGQRLAEISNPRIDRGTLISLEEKSADSREKLDAAKSKKQTDIAYTASLDSEIANQAAQLKMQLQSQIEELRARVAQSTAMSGEKKALVDRQSDMVARSNASMDMLKPTQQQYSAALHNTDAENFKLNQKVAQLDALNKGIYVGDDLIAINVLAQKRRDIDLDAKSLEIEERQQSGLIGNLQRIIDVERARLEKLSAASVISSGPGTILTVGAATGRHVSPGDTIASVVDCNKRFVVAIFSYRQGESMKPGTHVRIDGGAFHSGVITSVLPKTSDKIDERFAVPFPQTERRELYAIITPDQADGALSAATPKSPACTVGQWVTVTRDNGIVPSMSVSWRRLGNFVASWTRSERPPTEAERLDAAVRLKTGLLSSSTPESMAPDQAWLPTSRAFVSR